MIADPLLLPLAGAMLAAYDAVPTFQNASKTGHVVHTVVNDINTFLCLGTMDWEEWVLDDFNPLIEASPIIGLVRLEALDIVQEILPLMMAVLQGLGWPPYYLAGHSKGADEAPLYHALMKEAGHRPLATRLYEPPRAGGAMLADYLAPDDILGTRMYNIHGDDQVTWLPVGFGFEDCCRLLRFRVPDTFGLKAKHRMPGVIAGITGGLS